MLFILQLAVCVDFEISWVTEQYDELDSGNVKAPITRLWFLSFSAVFPAFRNEHTEQQVEMFGDIDIDIEGWNIGTAYWDVWFYMLK